jgi:hypothetical protein
MREQPQRTCIVCRKKGDKKDFIRIVRTPQGDFVLDKTGKVSGRGAYICASQDCIEKCVKTRALNRAFKQEISKETYDKILEDFNEQD